MSQAAPTEPESRQHGRPGPSTVVAPVGAEIRSALHSVPPEDALDVMGTDRSTGLSPTEADRRRAIYGENWLERRGAKSILSLLVDQVRSLIVWLLFAAAALSLITNDIPEAMAIICVLVINTAIGFFHVLACYALNGRSLPSGRYTGTYPARRQLASDVRA